jgi:hypothetical protein
VSRIACLLFLLLPSHLFAQRPSLSVLLDGEAVELSQLAARMSWRSARPGVEWTEVQLRAGFWRLPVRAVIARIDPRAFDFELSLLTRANRMTGAWTVDSAGSDVAIALNAGQFKETGPWGWLVMDGRERRDPGFGPLSGGVAIDNAGRFRWLGPTQLGSARADRSIRHAFQSFPLLLLNDSVPTLLRTSADVDRRHRDARLMFAQQNDSVLLVVLTRYDGFGGATPRIPIGLTVPESLQLIRALGARHAIMLDGGLSAQLLLRTPDGDAFAWKGLREVPLGLVARPKGRSR